MGYAGTVDDIEWPTEVEAVEGQWLWIEDKGGYHYPPVSGWVNASDVLEIEHRDLMLHDAYTYYTGELEKSDDPWLHWALGIYLENAGETRSTRMNTNRLGNWPVYPTH